MFLYMPNLLIFQIRLPKKSISTTPLLRHFSFYTEKLSNNLMELSLIRRIFKIGLRSKTISFLTPKPPTQLAPSPTLKLTTTKQWIPYLPKTSNRLILYSKANLICSPSSNKATNNRTRTSSESNPPWFPNPNSSKLLKKLWTTNRDVPMLKWNTNLTANSLKRERESVLFNQMSNSNCLPVKEGSKYLTTSS